MRFSLRILKLVVFTGFFLLLWGCLEYTITTQVMPDGRLLRTISVKGDSSGIFKGSLRVPADSAWTITTRYEKRQGKDSVNGREFVYEATREFPNFRSVNDCFYSDSGFSDHLIIRVGLSKKSKWFYTYYTYTETYSSLFPFRSVPIGAFLTDSEFRLYVAGDDGIYYSPAKDSLMIRPDSLSIPPLTAKDSLRFKELRDQLDGKFESWQKINMYNDFYEVVCKALDKCGREADTVNARKPFYHWLDSALVFDKVLESNDAFVSEASAFFRMDTAELIAGNREGFDLFSKKCRVSAFALESFTNQVLMPGMILEANTSEKRGNLVVWHFKIGNFYVSDYTMIVRSRAVNKVAVVVAAILLVLLISLPLFRLFRKP
jgi:hypothetical protein